MFTHLSFVSCSKASFLFTKKHSPLLMGTSVYKNSLQKGLLEKNHPCSGLHISLKAGQNFGNTNPLQFYLLLVGGLSGKGNGLQALRGLHTKSWEPKKPERLAMWLRTLKVRSELQGVSLLQELLLLPATKATRGGHCHISGGGYGDHSIHLFFLKRKQTNVLGTGDVRKSETCPILN